MMPGEFRWKAWDENRWDHYWHAGVQERFYRVCPRHLGGSGFEEPEPRWIDYLLRICERISL